MNTTLALVQLKRLYLTAEIIDVRQLMEVFETLEASGDDPEIAHTLQLILAELAGYGGDEQWRGDWYPVTLIADYYFTDYVREMLIGCGTIHRAEERVRVPRDLPEWVEIDWDATAENLKVDYASIEIGGNTYWYH
jgi:hypothetical protein